MKVEYKPRTNEYDVTINRDDLLTAFISENEFNKFIHEIATNTVGEQMADMLFPLKKGDNDENI